jgi:acyl carrier protein
MAAMVERSEVLRQIGELAPARVARPVRLEQRLVEDLGLDSVGLLTLAVAVEDHFHICLEPEDEEGIRTIGDLVRVVEGKLGG